MNDDGTFTHSRSNDGWAFADQGAVEPKRKLTAEQAKEERPELAERIREALGSASKSGR